MGLQRFLAICSKLPVSCKIHPDVEFFASQTLSSLLQPMPGHGTGGYHLDQVGGGGCLRLSWVLSPCPIAGLGGGPCPSGLKLGHPSLSHSFLPSPYTPHSFTGDATGGFATVVSHRVDPKHPYTVASLQALEHLLVLLSKSLYGQPETDDTYESSILVASPSVRSRHIPFPEPQDISFDTSILRPTASAYTFKSRTN
jgi:hypothetical protein